MKNIVLTGFMCSGKSTIGKMLSKRMGFKFIDSDEYIEKKYAMTISDIFAKFGEERFREIESECIKEISEETSAVIATGGGAVLRPKNVESLKKNGVVFYLEVSADTVITRRGEDESRPLLNNSSKEDVEKRLNARRKFYDNNDFKINADKLSPMQVCDLIIESYNLV